jgi:Fe-S-cluster containining protein
MAVDTVCQACGLCCDGTLFTRVPIGADEVLPAALGVVTTPTGGRFLPQRCAGLQGTCCTVYPQRPLACRRFECLLVVAQRDGEVSEAGALEVVAKARALQAEGAHERLAAHLAVYFQRP